MPIIIDVRQTNKSALGIIAALVRNLCPQTEVGHSFLSILQSSEVLCAHRGQTHSALGYAATLDSAIVNVLELLDIIYDERNNRITIGDHYGTDQYRAVEVLRSQSDLRKIGIGITSAVTAPVVSSRPAAASSYLSASYRTPTSSSSAASATSVGDPTTVITARLAAMAGELAGLVTSAPELPMNQFGHNHLALKQACELFGKGELDESIKCFIRCSTYCDSSNALAVSQVRAGIVDYFMLLRQAYPQHADDIDRNLAASHLLKDMYAAKKSQFEVEQTRLQAAEQARIAAARQEYGALTEEKNRLEQTIRAMPEQIRALAGSYPGPSSKREFLIRLADSVEKRVNGPGSSDTPYNYTYQACVELVKGETSDKKAFARGFTSHKVDDMVKEVEKLDGLERRINAIDERCDSLAQECGIAVTPSPTVYPARTGAGAGGGYGTSGTSRVSYGTAYSAPAFSSSAPVPLVPRTSVTGAGSGYGASSSFTPYLAPAVVPSAPPAPTGCTPYPAPAPASSAGGYASTGYGTPPSQVDIARGALTPAPAPARK